MLVDTHCHINMMVKKSFDTILTQEEITQAAPIVQHARQKDVRTIINVGTSLIESKNCIALAQTYDCIYAAIGIHPNDLTSGWQADLKEIKSLLKNKTGSKIVGIGECGLDFHYPDYNLQRQKDAFKAQIELALENDLGLVVHTRDARDQTLRALEEFKGQITHGIIHCFSEDSDFAQTVIEWGFAIGIGGIITYPKNNYLREIVKSISLDFLVLETDAPFLPIQEMRGKQNAPQYIANIAQFIAQLRNEPLAQIADETTKNALRIFALPAQHSA